MFCRIYLFLLHPLLMQGFSTFWNAPTWHCYVNRMLPTLANYGIIENSDAKHCTRSPYCTNEYTDQLGHKFVGDKIAVFYEFNFGRYPYYNKYKKNEPVNGGSPLFANMSAHLKVVEENITKNLPDTNFDGLLVIDFEEWRPLYRYNSGVKKVYQETALEFARTKYPSESDHRDAARELFNEAAMDFVVETIRVVKTLRPHARVGLYGLPYCNYNAGERASEYKCSLKFQQFNNDMSYIYNESTALFPSIYLGFPASKEQRFRYIHAILSEAKRISEWYNPPLPIYAYSKFEYNPLIEFDSSYNKYDLCSTIKPPADFGVNGLIYWSSSANMKNRCGYIRRDLEGHLGHINNNTVNEFIKCRQRHCSGQGRCVRKTTDDIELLTETCDSYTIDKDDYICYCDNGYTGPNCSDVVTSEAAE